MLDDDKTTADATEAPTGTAEGAASSAGSPEAPARAPRKTAKKAAARKTTRKTAAKPPADEAATADDAQAGADASGSDTGESGAAKPPAKKAATKKAAAKRTAAKKAPADAAAAAEVDPSQAAGTTADAASDSGPTGPGDPTAVLFKAPEVTPAPRKKQAQRRSGAATDAAADTQPDKAADEGPGKGTGKGGGKGKAAGTGKGAGKGKAAGTGKTADRTDVEADVGAEGQPAGTGEGERVGKADGETKGKGSGTRRGRDEVPADDSAREAADDGATDGAESDDDGDEGGEGTGEQTGARRRRRRGGRRRRKPSDGEGSDESGDEGEDDTDDESSDEQGEGGGTRRRRRRRREGDSGGGSGDDPDNTVTRVRKPRSAEDEITSVQGSTRLEAKKQRRREGREAGRRRAPIVSEAEFLARRESVDRVMVIRQEGDLTQIGVLEDKVLVEHYVARESQTSLIGNVYVGRVQNVLPSMEAAFIDIGKGRNAVLYAGEVNWSALGHKDGQPRKIESVLSSGQSVLVQVTKDPIGHKGARLTSQVSLAGRFLVYVPDGTTSGISRKLPDTERNRLKTLLKEIVPDTAGVIVRTAAEGASEDELTRDVERLKARWEDIESKAKSGSAPKLLYGEPDLTLKVVRDLFTEDFSRLVIQGDEAWDTVQQYVKHVAPDLEDRLERFEASDSTGDVFAAHRIDEQIAKGLDRKVWLPSGGSLIIDRTEAMTVVDVNTGKFTGSGGNLEETVTKNNLEAAEEIVRQLRLRDIGGIIVVDFIDMVLESNRDLVLRRLVECLGRDRTRHQVAEVTSLGLVQMTRKRIGTGLLEAFSESCEHCQGRGLVLHDMPVEPRRSDDDGRRGGRRGRGGRGGGNDSGGSGNGGSGNGKGSGNAARATPTPKDVAAVARPENAERPPLDEPDGSEPVVAPSSGAVIDEAEVMDESPGEPTPAPEESAPEKAPAEDAGPPAQAAPEKAAAEEAAAPEPAEPAAPKLVTRTRRAASRPAGSAATTAPAPVVVQPEAAPADSAPAPVVEPPRVVTRTRRAVSRPAGAAASTDSTTTPPPATVGTATDEGVSEDEAAATEADGHAELHVPIKKKGSRKR